MQRRIALGADHRSLMLWSHPSQAVWYDNPMPRYVALLRGINVGGKNLIKMPALKA